MRSKSSDTKDNVWYSQILRAVLN